MSDEFIKPGPEDVKLAKPSPFLVLKFSNNILCGGMVRKVPIKKV